LVNDSFTVKPMWPLMSGRGEKTNSAFQKKGLQVVLVMGCDSFMRFGWPSVNGARIVQRLAVE
jgi:hypothetical protein